MNHHLSIITREFASSGDQFLEDGKGVLFGFKTVEVVVVSQTGGVQSIFLE